jgi:hypothetical protein
MSLWGLERLLRGHPCERECHERESNPDRPSFGIRDGLGTPEAGERHGHQEEDRPGRLRGYLFPLGISLELIARCNVTISL